MNRVVVKDDWESSFTDELSEFFWTWFVGAPILGGLLVTGVGIVHGYMTTPQNENVFPNIVSSVKMSHVKSWEGISYAVSSVVNIVNEMRPEGREKPPVIETTTVPGDNVIPQPITDVVPDVGECDPYGPMDFSYDPPRLVCQL
jgi:hypothetical protein